MPRFFRVRCRFQELSDLWRNLTVLTIYQKHETCRVLQPKSTFFLSLSRKDLSLGILSRGSELLTPPKTNKETRRCFAVESRQATKHCAWRHAPRTKECIVKISEIIATVEQISPKLVLCCVDGLLVLWWWCCMLCLRILWLYVDVFCGVVLWWAQTCHDRTPQLCRTADRDSLVHKLG
jgi:hypothetical protein